MKPKIGITTGCPCGIGPEIVEKAIRDPRVLDVCEPIVFGALPTHQKCGEVSMRAVDDAVHAVMTGEIEAIVTAPINKSHWKAAGSPFAGHTEYLAHVTGSNPVAMMMVSPRLKVSLVTTHLPLAEVPGSLTVDKICSTVKLTYNFLQENRQTGKPANQQTNIAICSLNPHAGDSGAFGNEEETIIIAIKQLRGEDINVSGPYPADTVFHKALLGEYAAVVAMYHDQGLIPIKTLDFKHTVNVTLGLPFVRTSPDHGTAEDIAGKGLADHTNMVAAIEMAVEQVRKCLST